MTAVCFIGIDPGTSGAIAVVNETGQPVDWMGTDATPADLWRWLQETTCDHHVQLAVIERVHSSPQMGVRSAFTFGSSAGFLQGIVTAAGLRHEYITPHQWQKSLRCLSGGDKNLLKRKAQELFPSQRMTQKNADAFLLAEFARRAEAQRTVSGSLPGDSSL